MCQINLLGTHKEFHSLFYVWSFSYQRCHKQHRLDLFKLLVILLPNWPCLQPVSKPSKTMHLISKEFKLKAHNIKYHHLSPNLAPFNLLISSSEQFLSKSNKSCDANEVVPFKILHLKNNLKFP